jgi:hypothetical protein
VTVRIMTSRLWVHVEEKEDVTGEGVVPGLPEPADLASQLTDILADVTKDDGYLGWRVLRVEPAS